MNKYIYVVLIKAHTGLGKISRAITGYEYTHIAVSFDSRLENFVTFSRRKHYAPFDAGFMHEKREHYAFGCNKNVKAKIFKLPVSQEALANIKKFVKDISGDNEYVFNLYSMITMPLLHGIKIYKAHNCMSFVAKIVQLSGAVHMRQEYYRYNIAQLDNLLVEFLYKECYLKREREDNEYMKPVNIVANVRVFLELNGKLIYRLVFMKNK